MNWQIQLEIDFFFYNNNLGNLVSGLRQDGNDIHYMKHNLDKTIDTKFHRDMLNTNIMWDVEGHMKYLWPFKNKTIGKWLQT
jgi:hypothetical protein